MAAPIPDNPLSLTPGDALLVVDVQMDFLPGGNLAVANGDEVVPVLNEYLALFQKRGLPVFAARDWHPANHCSFQAQGGIWPVHCVADSDGASFPGGLNLPPTAQVISKATQPDQEAYSGFAGTDLATLLQSDHIRRLFIGGLATDYCVLNTVKDALQSGFTVYLLQDAVRAVNLKPDDGLNAVKEMVQRGSRTCTLDSLSLQTSKPGALLTDLYQLTMLQSYFDLQMNDTAVFEFYIRRLPPGRGFLMAAGLEQVLQYLETLRFSSQERQWLKECGYFSGKFADSLETFRFTGDVHALPEGTLFFDDEPVLRITAPLPEAQLVETRIINLLQYQIMIASKAARMALAAPGKTLIDFGLRRAHGAEAGLFAARASYVAGFTGTATVQAAAVFDIPMFGTMAHSFIQAHDDEAQAFENFARSHPENVVLLIDTYDTGQAARKVVALAQKLEKEGITIKGVRIDSGDLIHHAQEVRKILDEGRLNDVLIFVSGDLDETALQKIISSGAPVDGFGIGTRLATSHDTPSLECVYKLQEYAGKARRKLSEKKSTLPGSKQVYRQTNADGKIERDILSLAGETQRGTALIQTYMQSGRRIQAPESLANTRDRAAEELRRLPDQLHQLKEDPAYSVELSDGLKTLIGAMAKK